MTSPALAPSLAVLLMGQAPPAAEPSVAAGEAPAVPAAPAFVPAERRDARALAEAIEDLRKRYPARMTVREIGTSAGKLPIHVLALSTGGEDAGRRPAILVVAGMDGTRWSGTEAALAAAEVLARDHEALLDEVTVFMVPRANPDAAERFAAGPRRDHSGDGVIHDNDRDGRNEEDAPRDLDGDGIITRMRLAGARPPWTKPTLVADPAEPRLLRAPDPATGEVPVFTAWAEGIDADGDGRIGEDWPGGIDPERNFPHRWPEFEDEAGAYPLLAPESKALAEWVIANPQVFGALVLGRHDTVVTVPDGKAKTPSGMPAMLDERDVLPYAELAKAWREITGQKRAEGRDAAGSLVAWMNAQRGVPTFASTLWGRPDLPPAAEGAAAAPKEGEASAKDGGTRKADRKPADEEGAAWLAYSDRVRGGSGFVPWHRVDHPQLDSVEVGGWVPGFRENPPLEDVAALGGKCASFLVRMAADRPRVTLSKPTAVALGPGIWRIDAALANVGRLPTVMRGGRVEGVTPAHVVRVSVPVDRVKSGRRIDVVRGLDPGEVRDCSWVLAAPADEAITVELLFNGVPVQAWIVRDGEVAAGGASAGGTP